MRQSRLKPDPRTPKISGPESPEKLGLKALSEKLRLNFRTSTLALARKNLGLFQPRADHFTAIIIVDH